MKTVLRVPQHLMNLSYENVEEINTTFLSPLMTNDGIGNYMLAPQVDYCSPIMSSDGLVYCIISK